MQAKPRTRSSSTTKPVKIKKQAKAQPMDKKKKDCSVLKPPVDASIPSFSELMKSFETGTPELKEIMDNECQIIYECRICRSLFRGLPNFLMHKRSYCLSRHKDINHNGESKMQTLLLVNRSNALSTRTTTRKDILELLDNVTNTRTNVNGPIVMREIEQTSQGLLNCFNHEGTQPTLEKSAALGPDGRVIGSDQLEESVNCPLCDSRFQTQNDLRSHASDEHPKLKEYFICPICKQYYAHYASIFRHMCKAHRKTAKEAQQQRPFIQKKLLNPDDVNRQRKKTNEDEISDMNRMKEETSCQTCGVKFDRKVTMIAHVATCGKQPLMDERKRSIQRDVTPPPLIKKVRTDYTKKTSSLKDINFKPQVIMTNPDNVHSPNCTVQRTGLETNKINDVLQSYNSTASLIQSRLERMMLLSHPVDVQPVIDLTLDDDDDDPIKEEQIEIDNNRVSKTHYEQTDSEKKKKYESKIDGQENDESKMDHQEKDHF